MFQKLHVAGLSGSGWIRSNRVRSREGEREREGRLGGEARVEKREEEKRER